MDFIKITAGRAYATELSDENYLRAFYENGDPSKNLLKAVTFKIHEGISGKFLSLLGLAIKVESGLTDPKAPKIVYLNKKSLINHTARFHLCHEKAIGIKDLAEKLVEAYSKPSKMTIDNKKSYTLCKKAARTQLKASKQKNGNFPSTSELYFQDGRAQFTAWSQFKDFYENGDPSKKIFLKALTFRAYEGILGKFLSLCGLAVKLESGLADPKAPKKIVYLNKKSFINHAARLQLYEGKTANYKDLAEKLTETYSKLNKMSVDNKKNYALYKEATRIELKAKLLPFTLDLYREVGKEYNKQA